MKLIKLDLACGSNKKDGFIGIDIKKFKGIDKKYDLLNGIPYKDNSIDEIFCSHFLEHLNFKEIDNLIKEMYRVCKNNALITIKVPHFSSFGAFHEHHRSFFRYDSFRDYYDCNYSLEKEIFKIEKIKLHLQHPFHFLNPLINKTPRFYEKFILKNIFPCFEIMFKFRVIKNNEE